MSKSRNIKAFLREPATVCLMLAFFMFAGSFVLNVIGVYDKLHLLALQSWALIFGYALLMGAVAFVIQYVLRSKEQNR